MQLVAVSLLVLRAAAVALVFNLCLKLVQQL
jgi:hypothetical protein